MHLESGGSFRSAWAFAKSKPGAGLFGSAPVLRLRWIWRKPKGTQYGRRNGRRTIDWRASDGSSGVLIRIGRFFASSVTFASLAPNSESIPSEARQILFLPMRTFWRGLMTEAR